MTTQIGEAPLTEPHPIDDTFVTGAGVESSAHVVRIVGWNELPYMSGETQERRISTRVVLPMDAAVRLHIELGRHLRAKGDGHAATSGESG